MTESQDHLVELAAYVVSAYIGNNTVPVSDLTGLITEVHAALGRAVAEIEPESVPEPLRPAIPVKKSVNPDFIICLEDGKKFKSLKRHLRTAYGMTPEEYREKWGLPADYPMVAPSYAQTRSDLARKIGLGQQRRRDTR